MNVIEEVIVQTSLDPWFDLKALSGYSSLSVRSLRAALADPVHPLPCYRMKQPRRVVRKPRHSGERPRCVTITGKVLVRKSDFDRWMEAHRSAPAPRPQTNLARLIDEALVESRR